MFKIENNKKNIVFIDFIPAISGLIGKVAITSSFAFMWALALNINNADFVFENVRIEILIASIITLVVAIFFSKAAPAGTLAPLVILIPFMAKFGVHPLVLGILVGLFGIVAAKTGILIRLTNMSKIISRNSITLAFGVSGIILSIEKLNSFFQQNYLILFVLLLVLSLIYAILFWTKKLYLIIPIAAVVACIIPYMLGVSFLIHFTQKPINLNPSYWWNDMWGIGYGFDIKTILITIPFAIFIIILWSVDTVSIQVLQENSYQDGQEKQEIDLKQSFIVVSIRNIVGVIFGGAQTSSLWRSFLIPLFMIKRPMRTCAILMSILGIIFCLVSFPISIMAYPPLVWSVLMFGIFVPFTVVSITNTLKFNKKRSKIVVLIISVLGIIINPIVTWITGLIYEKIEALNNNCK